MAKKKRNDKDTDKDKAQEGNLLTVNIPPRTFGIAGVSPEMLNTAYITPRTFGIAGISPEMLNTVYIPPATISLEQDLEDKINDLRKGNRKLAQEIEEKQEALKRKEIKIDELRETVKQHRVNEEEMRKHQRLQHLFYRVHPLAWEKLNKDEEFRKLFEQKKPCPSVIMAIDIRRSTELMLKAKDANSYQSFIITLCSQLKQIILDNYGVFDKFTGDGILTFFPEFYSGDDATYLALKAANECHAYFSEHYENNRSCFTTILKDVGLGIGIDYGDAHLVNIQDWLTVIGTPVVYACRLSGAPAGQTLVNQQAYDVISQKFGGYINFQDSELHVKNEGNILVYMATPSKKTYGPKLPDWLSTPSSPKT